MSGEGGSGHDVWRTVGAGRRAPLGNTAGRLPAEGHRTVPALNKITGLKRNTALSLCISVFLSLSVTLCHSVSLSFCLSVCSDCERRIWGEGVARGSYPLAVNLLRIRNSRKIKRIKRSTDLTDLTNVT